MVWSFEGRTTFLPFDDGTEYSAADKASLLAAMQTAYDGSSTARTMFENWIATGNNIVIKFEPGAMAAIAGTGELFIDLAFLTNATYIDKNGTAVKDTLVTALVHELGHALTGRLDNDITSTESPKTSDYRGDNVNYVNQIYRELGLPEQVSYIAYDTSGTYHQLNYQYTNGTAIDAAVSVENQGEIDWSTAELGTSNDLLIGGSSNNILQGSAGNDFLFGAGGDDYLNGEAGSDTVVLTGKPTDYDIRYNPSGTWTSRHVRGSSNEGTDTFANLEKVQFEGGETFNLKKKGLTYQTDFALVIDTTGSMGDDIDAVKSQGTAIINALFAGDTRDARIGIVGFKDNTIGEPTSVLLPFTNQDMFADRKSSALAALNSISVSGGGDLPETGFDGLLKALDGTMGQWRPGAGVHRVALFTDASAKDGALAGAVSTLAADIGATITSGSIVEGARGDLNTFTLEMNPGTEPDFSPDFSQRDPSSSLDYEAAPRVLPEGEPPTPDTSEVSLEIYTIYTGNFGSLDPAYEDIATITGGDSFNAPDPDDLVDALLEIIELPTDDSIEGTSGRDNLTGTSADNVFIGSQGRDQIATGDGADILKYASIVEAGDKITDFEIGADKFDFSELLDSFNYLGSDAFADGYIDVIDGRGSSLITVDTDGSAGTGRARPFALVESIAVADFDNTDNFIL